MEIKVYKLKSKDELDDLLIALEKEERENRKDAERDAKEVIARYDRFIDLILDLTVCVADCGSFTRDSEIFREHMHEAPLHIKRSFVRNFSMMLDEVVSDIMGITAECVVTCEKKTGSNDKEKDEKGKDKSHPKSKKENTNHKKK